jgi:hypothetical protein
MDLRHAGQDHSVTSQIRNQQIEVAQGFLAVEKRLLAGDETECGHPLGIRDQGALRLDAQGLPLAEEEPFRVFAEFGVGRDQRDLSAPQRELERGLGRATDLQHLPAGEERARQAEGAEERAAGCIDAVGVEHG